MQKTIESAYTWAEGFLGQGHVATFIPELAKQNPNQLGLAITTCDGTSYQVGDCHAKFTIQSISKLFLLAVALEDSGFDHIFSRVGLEPSGDQFNSIYRLETERGPANPMINAGAIAVSGCIRGETVEQRVEKVLALAAACMGVSEIERSAEVFRCEVETGHRNRALAHMMQGNGVLDGNVNEHLETYYHACSMMVDCAMLSRFGAVLANGGRDLHSGRQLLDRETARLLRTLMASCGLYNRAGEFAWRVGVPAKSGSGGGIMAAVPGRMGIGTFSPLLDERGNSVCGQKALEYLSRELDLPVY